MRGNLRCGVSPAHLADAADRDLQGLIAGRCASQQVTKQRELAEKHELHEFDEFVTSRTLKAQKSQKVGSEPYEPSLNL
jgi:hypothetical protein